MAEVREIKLYSKERNKFIDINEHVVTEDFLRRNNLVRVEEPAIDTGVGTTGRSDDGPTYEAEVTFPERIELTGFNDEEIVGVITSTHTIDTPLPAKRKRTTKKK